MLDVDRIITPRGFLRRKYITGAEETRNMHKVLLEESSFGRQPGSMRSEGGDIIKNSSQRVKHGNDSEFIEVVWWNFISAKKKGTFFTEVMSCTRQFIITN